MSTRKDLSSAIGQLLPNIIQGVHLGFLAKRTITHTQFFILIAIHSHGQCSVKTLAQNMHVSMPTISGIVDRLVRAGYLSRYEDPQDRRLAVIRLQAKGRALIAEFQSAVSERWYEILGVLNSQELEAMKKIIMNLKQNLRPAK